MLNELSEAFSNFAQIARVQVLILRKTNVGFYMLNENTIQIIVRIHHKFTNSWPQRQKNLVAVHKKKKGNRYTWDKVLRTNESKVNLYV